jgi:type II secretory pathway component PulF
MSRDPGEPPRRPKPRPKPKRPDDSAIDGEGPSTFRPSSPPPDPPRAGIGPSPRKKGEPREQTGGPGWFERVIFGSVSAGHLATFCRQASAYLEAGVDLSKALGSLENQFARTALGPVIGRLQQAVRRGNELGEAMAREPQAFDALFLSMVRVAEARGGLPEALRRMARHYEARQRMIRQARSALIYPAAVTTVALGVGWLLTAFVLPKIVGLLEDMTRGKADLPAPTRMLMAISHFIQSVGWWAVPIAAAVGVFLLLRFYRTAPGKAALDELALMIPVLGTLLKKLDTTRFARTLGALLEAGVDYSQSLDLTAEVVQTSPLRRAVKAARTEVMEGSELSSALHASRRFPDEVIAMVETGEETGKLPETLDKLADNYEEQVEYMVKNLGSLLQPVILITLGGIAFFIALAFISAYVSVLAGLAGGGL